MAKIIEEVIVVKVSTLVPDNAEMTPIMDSENVLALKQVVEEFAGDNRTLVEIELA